MSKIQLTGKHYNVINKSKLKQPFINIHIQTIQTPDTSGENKHVMSGLKYYTKIEKRSYTLKEKEVTIH